MRRAPAATPRRRPDERPKKLTRRSASPSGHVFRMMASVSRAGIMSARRQRVAHCAEPQEAQPQKGRIFLPHACLLRRLPGELPEKFRQAAAEENPAVPAGLPSELALKTPWPGVSRATPTIT